MVRRFQNKIAESKFAFPLVASFALVLTILKLYLHLPDRMFMIGTWCQIGLIASTSVLIALLNTTHALIRKYSRMVVCSFLIMLCAGSFLIDDIVVGTVCLSFALFFTITFREFQSNKSAGSYYFAFLSVGCCCLLVKQLMFYVPFLWFCCGVYLLSLNLKSFLASLLGTITPFWFATIYYVYTQNIDSFIASFDIFNFFQYGEIGNQQIYYFSFITLLYIIGTVHFLRNNYRDKMKVRMCYYCFILIGFVSICLTLLFPQLYDSFVAVYVLCTSPLIGHFIALTNTRVTNCLFIILLMISTILIVYNF